MPANDRKSQRAIPRSSSQLNPRRDITEYDNIVLPLNYSAREMAALGVADDDFKILMIVIMLPVATWRIPGRDGLRRGFLFIEDIEREGDGPWTSEFKVSYEQVANLATLNRVFVTNVIDSAKNVWLSPALTVFAAGTRQFNTLLGTLIGKLVVYFVFGAYGQGNRHITWIAV